MDDIGLIIGHFEPLHLGHMRSILQASGQVKSLHVVITPTPSPHPDFDITLQDKARWLQMACADLPFIHIHTTDTSHLPICENFAGTINFKAANQGLQRLLNALNLPIITKLFINERHQLTQHKGCETSLLNVITLPLSSDIDSYAIAKDPIGHWHLIHPQARSNYTKTIAIVGGESSGKTTLVHKLANYYGASFALEMGRLYVSTDLGGKEVGLQYSDYMPIALDHAQAIRQATATATAPVTFIDTDFVTTQAFCEVYEKRTHPFVAACIDECRLDHTIMLDNSTPWVADGMRSLGSPEARGHFEQLLLDIFARHHIQPYVINSPDYDARYQQALTFINQHIYNTRLPSVL